MTATRPTTCTLTVSADGATCGKPAVVVHTFKMSDGFYAECAEHATDTAADALTPGMRVRVRKYGTEYSGVVARVSLTRVAAEIALLGGKTKTVLVPRTDVSRA